MIQEYFFFESDKYQLFAVLNSPEQNPKNTGIILCHSFGEERTYSHRALFNCSRFLTNHGYHTLLFDYRGTGESTDDFEIGTISGYLEDIHNAINTFKSKTNIDTIGLFGFRFGASLVSLFENKANHDIKFQILCNPIINGKKYINNLLRLNISCQMATYKKIINNCDQLIDKLHSGELVNLAGYYINGTFYKEMIKMDLFENNLINPIKSLIIDINKKNSVISYEMQNLHNIINPTHDSTIIPVIELCLWKNLKIHCHTFQNLPNEIIKWLNI